MELERSYSKRALFEMLGYAPHPGQIEVHRSRAPRRVIACGVRWGKTLLAAMEALAASLEPKERSIGWCVAPTYDLADRIFREVQVIALNRLHHRVIAMKENERRLILRNLAGGESEIRAKSADNPVSLLGEGLDFVVVDEASRLKPAIWQSFLSQRLIDKQGWALLISTPKGKGYFYDLFRRGQGSDPDFASWNYPSWTNPLLDKDVIEAERARLPERVFRSEFGAEFIEGSGQVFRSVRDRATGAWQNPEPGKWYFAGLDLGKTEDLTVLVIMNKKHEVVFCDRFHRLDWTIQINRIKSSCDRYNKAHILVDSTGAGEPIYETMCKAGCRVEGYPFTVKSKAALINNLSLMFEQNQLVLPRADLWPEGVEELEAFSYSVTDSGNVRTEAPSGVHDDCVVALALAAWQNRPSEPYMGTTQTQWY